MAISPLSGLGTEPKTPEKSANAGMDKDGFLKLLIAQISNQDPLQPMQGAEFVAQLSQFAVVEQAMAQSSKLDIVSTQLRGISSNEAAGLVGKTVSMRGHGLAFDGVLATSTSFSLDGQADKVTVAIKDSKGQTVRTMELGSRPPGPVSVNWDGRDNSGEKVPAGSYTVAVTARDANGGEVMATQDVTGTVTKVSFEKGYPEITLDSGVSAPVSDLVSVAAPPAGR